jgi:hypothetical protein
LAAAETTLTRILHAEDPFNALPGKMPPGSHQLLNYFFNAICSQTVNKRAKPSGVSSDRQLMFKDDAYLHSTIVEPKTLHTVLILAAIDFSWQTGGLRVHERSFLFHKAELLRLFSNWIPQDAMRIPIDILRLLAILSLSESCVGNYLTGETHLQGLLTILEIREAEWGASRSSQEDELLERFIILYVQTHGVL